MRLIKMHRSRSVFSQMVKSETSTEDFKLFMYSNTAQQVDILNVCYDKWLCTRVELLSR